MPFPKYLPRSSWAETSDVVFGPVFSGPWSGRHKGVAGPARGPPIWRGHATREEAALGLLQLLHFLPLVRGPRSRHPRRLARGQQRVAMGLRGLHYNDIALHRVVLARLSILSCQSSHREPHHNHVQGNINKRSGYVSVDIYSDEKKIEIESDQIVFYRSVVRPILICILQL